MNRIIVALMTWVTMSFTFMGLSSIITPGGWQWNMIGLPLFITAGMLGIVTLAGQHRKLGGAGSIVVGLLVWVCYLTNSTGGGVIPTPDAMTTLASHLSDAVLALPNYGRPASNPDLFVPLGMVGLGPMCVLAVFLALVIGSPVAVGIPALGCWAVFLSGGPEAGLGWAIASVASYLLLLGISPKKNTPGRFQAISLPVLAVSAVLAILASIVLPLAPGWGQSQSWLNFWNGNYTDNTGINVDGPIQVGDSLRTQSSTLLFHTQGEFTGPLKMGTLDQFTGQSWVSSVRIRARAYQEGTVVWNQSNDTVLPDTTGWSEGPSVIVRIDQLSGQVVPSGEGPRSITAMTGLGLTYDSGTDSFRSRGALNQGDSYVTNTMVLDRSVLRGARISSYDSLLNPSQIAHADEIRELTLDIIDGAVIEDDMLQAIETYLRGEDFTYTLTPVWESRGDPVWDFLQAKRGYCVHFATAMAVMAMSVGIPMQVSVGYLPGFVESDDWRGVTGARAHMWPQAYITGVGWVRYEPTPAVGTGEAVDPGNVALPTEEVPEEEPTIDSTVGPQAPATAGPTGPGANQAGASWRPWVGVGAGLGGAGLVVVVWWLVYVRLYSPERAWRVILGAGVKKGYVTQAMSVRTAAKILETRLDASLGAELEELREAVEISRYGPADVDRGHIPGKKLWKLKQSVVRQVSS